VHLSQVRGAGFPARLREYLSVARMTSHEFRDVKVNSFASYFSGELYFACTLAPRNEVCDQV